LTQPPNSGEIHTFESCVGIFESIKPTKMKTSHLLSFPLAIALAVATTNAHATSSYTDPVGYNTVVVPGNQISIASFNLTQPTLYQRAITDFDGAVIFDDDQAWPAAGELPAGELGAVNSDNKSLYYVEFRSGEFAEGLIIDIVAVDREENSLTLADDVSILLDGDESYAIRKHTTFADAFGADNSAGFKAGTTAGSADKLYWINSNGQWVGNFYRSGFSSGWRRIGDTSGADKADSIVPLKGSLYIAREDPASLELTISGQVKVRTAGEDIIGMAQHEIYPGNNLVSNIWPVEFTLANSGLRTGDSATGLRSGTTAGSADNVYVIKDGQWVGYYHNNGFSPGWRTIANTPINPADVHISPAEGIYIVRRGSIGFTWIRDLADTQN